MKTIRYIRSHRNSRRPLISHCRLSLPLLLMVLGYLIGCIIGIIVAIKSDVEWLRSLLPDLVDKQSSELFTVFCGCAVYVVGLLFLATSYLGFLFVPTVFSVKGFFSSSVFTACVRSVSLELACAELFLPGIFLLPAMLILGLHSMQWSVQLLRCRAGELVPQDPTAPRTFGSVFVLLLVASAMKAYVVPYVLNLL